MADNIELEIVTSTDMSLKTVVKEVYIPAFFGRAGVLTNHLPYISLLQYGEISYEDLNAQKQYLFVEHGFVEVLDNKIVIMSDLIEKGENLKKQESVQHGSK